MKAARIAVESFQESAFRMRASYNVTVVQSISPTSLPSSKDIRITIKYNCWLLLKFKLPPLSDVICSLPYFRHWSNAFKGKTSDVVIFEQITDSLPFSFFFFFFSIYYNSDYFCLRSYKAHPQENEKFMRTTGQFSRTDSLPFKDRSFSCTLDLIDLVMQIQPFQKGWTLKPDVSH